jgi:hypothetical protein
MTRVIESVRVVSEFVEGGANPTSVFQTSFIARSRCRTEFSSDSAYDIERRDLKKTIRVFRSERNYQELPIFELLSPAERVAFETSGRHWAKFHVGQPTAHPVESHVHVEYFKTSELSMKFGCVARKWLIEHTEKRRGQFLETFLEKITEAWYLDVDQTSKLYPNLQRGTRQSLVFATVGGEMPTIEQGGEVPEGFCALSISKISRRSEQATASVTKDEYEHRFRVVSMEETTVPQEVFEPPHGFRKVSVYPSRLTMAKQDALDVVKRLKYKVASAHFNRASRG